MPRPPRPMLSSMRPTIAVPALRTMSIPAAADRTSSPKVAHNPSQRPTSISTPISNSGNPRTNNAATRCKGDIICDYSSGWTIVEHAGTILSAKGLPPCNRVGIAAFVPYLEGSDHLNPLMADRIKGPSCSLDLGPAQDAIIYIAVASRHAVDCQEGHRIMEKIISS